ncbi:hypothetical protein JCM14076_16710 [Methylosoma difficile]
MAEVIVLDQFSRNIYRDSPQAFAEDAQALTLAQAAIAIGAHRQLLPTMRAFLYMPFMHSESLQVHEQAVVLFAEADMDVATLQFELKHKAIIERFGRYPHRNPFLGRTSTEEEKVFLTQPGSAF